MKETKSKNKIRNSIKPGQIKSSKGKDKKNQEEEDEEKKEEPPKENPYNLERFVYISTYDDSNLMTKLKNLFEDVNQKAFNLVSTKEIYTRGLTEEEKDNNEIDYISGFQLIDKTFRITILEGITGKGMNRIKAYLPKTQLNTDNLKIFADSTILFNKRIYSNFGLCLKLIKLRKNLTSILQVHDIYAIAHRCREIYDTFQIFGSLIKAETMRDITLEGLFPQAEHLIMLERKYADLLTDQDITGIFKEKKKRRIIRLKDLMSSTSNTNSNTVDSSKKSLLKNKSNIAINSAMKRFENRMNKDNKAVMPKVHLSKSQANITSNVSNISKDLQKIHKMKFKPKTDSRNEVYEKFLKEKSARHIPKNQIWESNLKHIEDLKQKIPSFKRFCMPCPEGCEIVENPKEILFCPTKNNYFDALTKKMREKYLKDKKHYYSYSLYSLALSFPMIERERNQKYLDYVENKSKWINKKDFDRFTQPEREKFYFPKINNVL